MASTVSLLPPHSQPFHNNFSNPSHFMKWSTTSQKPISSSSQVEDNQSTVISHDHHHHHRVAAVDSSEKNKESTAASASDHHRRPKIVIKFRVKNDNRTDHDHDHTQVQNQTLVTSDSGDSSNQNIKPWNLRSSSSRNDQDHDKSARTPVQDHASHDESSQLGLGLVSVAEKLEKRKLSISIALTKEEIEADILAITGSKPTRRPKKRPKNVQRQLDNLFPGICLKSITPNTYK
ncbi:hypothetical protein ACOSQ3_003596 [Xanthoceras sorbifolium]